MMTKKEAGKNQIKGMFTFDGPIYKDVNEVYCSVTLTNEMFSRFFAVVDTLYVVVRTFESDKTYSELNLKPLNTNNMVMVDVPNIVSAKGLVLLKNKFKADIKSMVEEMDMIFARMPSITSNSIIEIARASKKPYLVEVGGCAWDSYWNHGLSGKVVAPYMYLCARKNIKEAAFATYVTKKFLQRRYPNKGVNTNCSNVYLTPVGEEILKERLKKIEATDLTHPVFGQAVNSIDVKYKGEHLILRAMKDLKERGIIAEFQVAGPGTGDFLKAEAERYGVTEQLKLLGTLQKPEMLEWLKSIDVYTQPSKQEGLPRSVIEAMSFGCVAVGSDLAGIPELLDKECLFNPDKNDQIVKALLWVLARKNMIAQAKVNFERAKEYNLADIEQRRKRIFEEYRSFIEG